MSTPYFPASRLAACHTAIKRNKRFSRTRTYRFKNAVKRFAKTSCGIGIEIILERKCFYLANLNKSELPDNLVDEQKEYERIKLLGGKRSSSGTGSFNSESSGQVYNSTSGELGVLQQLNDTLHNFHITAEDWNTLCGLVLNAAHPTLHYPKLNSPWQQMYGNEPTYYYKDLTGRVYVTGMITSGNTGGNFGSVIFTLPSGFRPQQNETFVVEAANNTSVQAAQIYVRPDGNVVMGIGNNSLWISLSTISFLAYN